MLHRVLQYLCERCIIYIDCRRGCVERSRRRCGVEDFGFIEMQDMQKRLQEKYKGKWEAVSPENGKNKLLWLVTELGEVADIIKKRGHDSIMTDAATRAHFIEEMSDVLMYFNDIMLCYGISVDELKKIYTDKQNVNLSRW